MAWTKEGGPVIVNLRVIWVSGVWETVYQRYLASKSPPIASFSMAKGAQYGQEAA
jgi:hypothetical protein